MCSNMPWGVIRDCVLGDFLAVLSHLHRSDVVRGGQVGSLRRRHRRNAGNMNTINTVYETLHRIYQKHRRKHLENGDFKQMCCMWSTDDPPDIVEVTPPFDDIEAAFGITFDEDSALELYDMDLDEAAARILDMQRLQSGAGEGNG